MGINHKPLNSLLTKFFRIDGLNHDCTTEPGGDGSTNSSTNSSCARVDETEDLKRKAHPEGMSTSQSRCNRNDNDDKAHSPGNNK